MIALVQRPRRKAHLAASHATDWWTVCDRVVPDFAGGAFADVYLVDSTLVARVDELDLCAECERLVTFAGTVAGDRVGRLVAGLAVAS